MKLATGRVVGGKVVIEGEPLQEGATVTVLAHEDNETFELGPQEEAELLHAIEQVKNGKFVDGDEFFGRLR